MPCCRQDCGRYPPAQNRGRKTTKDEGPKLQIDGMMASLLIKLGVGEGLWHLWVDDLLVYD